MPLKQGDYVVIHSLPEADGEILECASNEFHHEEDGKPLIAIKLKGKGKLYNVDFLQEVKIDAFLKNFFTTNKTRPQTVEMMDYIYTMLLENKDGMYSKCIVKKLKQEKDFVYSNTTTLMNRVMEKYPEVKKPFEGFYIVENK
ncbi:hypothetical protein VXF94_21305 (plasmid) [Bacillus amyloliquefaciens]|uniref:Rok-like winged helix domain-containing protein n=1 Tax=Bacillus amyloliquefaciens TaxID=1390 RepID=UPI002ED900A9